MREADERDPALGLGLRQVIRHVSGEKRHMVGTAFEYQVKPWPIGSQSLGWLLYFYGQPEFVCTSFLRRDMLESTRSEATGTLVGMLSPKPADST